MTQDDRYHVVMNALWFSAIHYRPEEGKLLAYVNVEQATHAILGMLDDLELLPALPPAVA